MPAREKTLGLILLLFPMSLHSLVQWKPPIAQVRKIAWPLKLLLTLTNLIYAKGWKQMMHLLKVNSLVSQLQLRAQVRLLGDHHCRLVIEHLDMLAIRSHSPCCNLIWSGLSAVLFLHYLHERSSIQPGVYFLPRLVHKHLCLQKKNVSKTVFPLIPL